MAPKKKSGTSVHPSTSNAHPPVASNAAGDTGARKDVEAAGVVAGAGGTGGGDEENGHDDPGSASGADEGDQEGRTS